MSVSLIRLDQAIDLACNKVTFSGEINGGPASGNQPLNPRTYCHSEAKVTLEAAFETIRVP